MKTAGKRKITRCDCIQVFDDDGNCISQALIAANESDYEDADGNRIEPWNEYQPFLMVQPQGMAVALIGDSRLVQKTVGPFTDMGEATRWCGGRVVGTECLVVAEMQSPYEEDKNV